MTGNKMPESERRKYKLPPDWPYRDIVDLPHHVSAVREPMEMYRRAAQFAPFSALTGYDDAIAETARLTDKMTEPDEDMLEEMNRRLADAAEHKREILITYYEPDEKKEGGRYVKKTGIIRKMEMGEIVLEDGTRISAAAVNGIEEADG